MPEFFQIISLDDIFLLVLLGAFAGLLAGMLGVGGGLVIVPALIFIFESWDFPDAHLAQMAVATSLATIIFTSLSSIYSHHRKGKVDWRLVRHLSFGIIAGAFIGAFVASQMLGSALRALFGLFAIAVALQMFFQFEASKKTTMPGALGLGLSGIVIAMVSSLFGIGGGSLSVPLLSYFGSDMKRAVAVSAACGFPIAVFSVLAFLSASRNISGLPELSLGYIYLPAVFFISLLSVVFAPLGASFAHALPSHQLKRVFAVFLSIVGLRLMVSSF
jgi:uncharacterized membrane protein YfcA